MNGDVIVNSNHYRIPWERPLLLRFLLLKHCLHLLFSGLDCNRGAAEEFEKTEDGQWWCPELRLRGGPIKGQSFKNLLFNNSSGQRSWTKNYGTQTVVKVRKTTWTPELRKLLQRGKYSVYIRENFVSLWELWFYFPHETESLTDK